MGAAAVSARRGRTSIHPLILLTAVVLCAGLPRDSAAQASPIGLPEVRARWFDNGIPSPGLDRLGWAIAAYGALFAEGFECGSTGRWSAAAP